MRDDKPIEWAKHPFNLPLFKQRDFEFVFEKPITIITGANGAGKSTFLEAVANHAGFSTSGGSRDHIVFDQEEEKLSQNLRFAWLPKMGNGFFLRSETFFKFIEGLDVYSRDGINANETLKRKSHGESFITVFELRFVKRGLYILDEPEAALSPRRQTELIQLLHTLEKNNQCQFIIATHSPLLMAYPNADLRYIEDGQFKKKEFHEIEHFKLMRDFYMYPDGFIAGLLQTETD